MPDRTVVYPDRTATSVYLPSELYSRLVAEAREQDRSINAEIIQALKAWLRGKQSAAMP